MGIVVFSEVLNLSELKKHFLFPASISRRRQTQCNQEYFDNIHKKPSPCMSKHIAAIQIEGDRLKRTVEVEEFVDN